MTTLDANLFSFSKNCYVAEISTLQLERFLTSFSINGIMFSYRSTDKSNENEILGWNYLGSDGSRALIIND